MRLACREKCQVVWEHRLQPLNPSIQVCLKHPGPMHSILLLLLPKSSCLELKTLTSRQTLQRLFLSWIPLCHSLDVCQLHCFLGLGAYCGLLCAWRSLIPVDSAHIQIVSSLFSLWALPQWRETPHPAPPWYALQSTTPVAQPTHGDVDCTVSGTLGKSDLCRH